MNKSSLVVLSVLCGLSASASAQSGYFAYKSTQPSIEYNTQGMVRPAQPQPAPKVIKEELKPVTLQAPEDAVDVDAPAPAESGGLAGIPIISSETVGTLSDVEAEEAHAAEEAATIQKETVPAPAQPKRLIKPVFTAGGAPVRPAPMVSVPTPELVAPAPAPSVDLSKMKAETSVSFEKGSSTLPADAQKMLDGLAAQLGPADSVRLQIRAYALTDNGNDSDARRLSLSRALMVRSYLTEKGIKPARLDVRAMGASPDAKGAPDRVDIILIQ